MSRLLLALLALFLLFTPPTRAATRGCALVFDRSISMRGFAAPAGGQIEPIVAGLSAACPGRYTFGVDLKPWTGAVGTGSVRSDLFTDKRTLLGAALRQWLDEDASDVAVFVTDNVADSGSADSQDQEKYYDLLKAPESGITGVTVILARLQFDGSVFRIGAGPSAQYRGSRAIAFYVLSRRYADPTTALAAVRSALRAQGLTPAGREPRPLDFIEQRLAPAPLTDRLNVPVHLEKGKGARTIDAGIVLDPAEVSRATTFTVAVRPSLSKDLRLVDAPLEAELAFPATAEFGPAVAFPCTPDPTTFTAKGDEVRVTCQVPPIAAKLTADQRKALARRGQAGRYGVLRVKVRLSDRTLALDGALKGWSYEGPGDQLSKPDPAVQQGIYHLKSLLFHMMPERERPVTIVEAPVLQRLWGFQLPGLGVLLGAGAAIAGVGALLALGLWSREYEIEVDRVADAHTHRLRFGQAQRVAGLEPDGVRLWPLGLGVFASSRRERVRPQWRWWWEKATFTIGDPPTEFLIRPARSARGGGGRWTSSQQRSRKRQR